jgi:hypothetical protein
MKKYLIVYVVTIVDSAANYHYQNMYLLADSKQDANDKALEYFEKVKKEFEPALTTCVILNIILL